MSHEELWKRYGGKKFCRRARNKNQRTVTLSVIDVTLGGDAVVKARGDAVESYMKQAQFLKWVAEAKEVIP